LDKNDIVTLDEWLAFFDKLHHTDGGESYYGEHGLLNDARTVYEMRAWEEAKKKEGTQAESE